MAEGITRFWDAVDTIHWAEVFVSDPQDPYPPFVQIEGDFESLLSTDARALALVLLAAAEEADKKSESLQVGGAVGDELGLVEPIYHPLVSACYRLTDKGRKALEG